MIRAYDITQKLLKNIRKFSHGSVVVASVLLYTEALPPAYDTCVLFWIVAGSHSGNLSQDDNTLSLFPEHES